MKNLNDIPPEIRNLPLSPIHIGNLLKSGLSYKTIIDAGIKSVPPDDYHRELGFNTPWVNSMYKIPYDDDYAEYRCFYTEEDEKKAKEKGEKLPKILRRKDTPNRLYIPKGLRDTINDVDEVFITEGVKKALKAVQEGIPCISISGLWNWKDKGEGLIPDFQELNIRRRVYIVPDNDFREPNRQGVLELAVYQLAEGLKECGASVEVVILPRGRENKGLDDYLCRHTAEEFRQLPKIKPVYVPRGDRHSTQDDYDGALTALGYEFALNEMNDTVCVNGKQIDDIVEAVILHSMRNYGYSKTEWVRTSIKKLADSNRYHPIRDYLDSLVWDGRDTISELAGYFDYKEDAYPLYLKKFLIGAVARVFANEGVENAMLVLNGEQGNGKSFFAKWLCPLKEYHNEEGISPDSKDCRIKRAGKWIWEVGELGSTTRRKDVEALKSFLTETMVTERIPYDKYPIMKPAIASFLGTVNNSGGFLNDATGSRRFLVVTVGKINWKYKEEIDVHQIWAQAVSLYKSGEDWNLSPEEKRLQNEYNSLYQSYEPLVDCIRQDGGFVIEPGNDKLFIPSYEIGRILKDKELIRHGDAGDFRRIAQALTLLGCHEGRGYVDGKRVRGWRGICLSSMRILHSLNNTEMYAEIR